MDDHREDPRREGHNDPQSGEHGPEAGALAVQDAELEGLPSTGLLSFYDRLRERVHKFVRRRAGKVGEEATEYLLLAPDLFILTLRLAMDRRVPSDSRALFGGALAYFVLPLDLMPELALGPMGFLDDLVLAAAVLSRAFDRDLESLAEQHWSGSGRLRRVLADVLESGRGLLGGDLYGKVKDLLARRGVDLEAEKAAVRSRDEEEPVY